jgi:hypothetical protein
MSVHGEFKLTINAPDGVHNVTASVDLDGDKLTGTLKDATTGVSTAIKDGHAHDGALHFKVHVDNPPADLEFKGKCDDTACTTLTGEVKGPMGAAPFKGVRA